MFSDGSFVLAVDIGGTKIAVGASQGDEVIILERFPTPREPAAGVRLIAETAKRCPNASRIAVVGVGAPGPLDSGRGCLLTPPNLPGWHNYPLASRLEAELGVPVRLENDANLGALGEVFAGSGRGLSSVFYFTISTGIGAGIIINERIHGGRNTMAGELWAFRPGNFAGVNDEPTVMDLASGPGLLRRAREGIALGKSTALTEVSLDTPSLLRLALEGDPVALETLEEGRNAVAALLVAVIETLAPEAVILGGGLCTDPRWFVEPVKERIRKWIGIPLLAETPVRRASLWDNAVLHGAAALCADFLKPR